MNTNTQECKNYLHSSVKFFYILVNWSIKGKVAGLPGAVGAAVGIEAQQDEEQEGEAPQRGAAVAEEG